MKGKKKIVSLVLMFLCIIFMFGNWIAFRNTKEKDEYIATWKLGAGASAGLSDLANMFGAQDARTSDSLKNASKAFNQMSKAVDDGKFTPVEIISMGSGLKAYKTVYGDYLDESASRSITIIQVMDVVYMLLFWAVIILLIFNIWNHLQDKSMRNTETIQLIFACAMFLFTLVIKAGMNNAFTEGSGARVLRLTIIPYLFVIFTAVGKVLWNQGVTAKEEPVIKTTVTVKADIPAAGAANRTAETGSQTVCPTCGAVISAEAQFCRKCGAKIEKPSVQPAAQSLKCPFCGAELKADDVFCQSCGKNVREAMKEAGNAENQAKTASAEAAQAEAIQAEVVPEEIVRTEDVPAEEVVQAEVIRTEDMPQTDETPAEVIQAEVIGKEVVPETQEFRCPYCGAAVRETDKFCIRCGKKLNRS